MTRTEVIRKKEESNLTLPLKAKANKYTRKELDELILKLAEAHGLI